MSTDYSKLAREIIFTNQYLALATTSSDGSAWVSPVAYAFDEKFRFYFISLASSQHIKNGMANSAVSFAIYDSRQNFGEGVGLQVEADLSKVPTARIPKVITLYLSRSWPFINDKFHAYMSGFQKVLKNHTYTAYMLTPKKVWMNDPDASTDVRIEVSLTGGD